AAVQRHATPLLSEMEHYWTEESWHLAPLTVAVQARVAIGDEIGALLGAQMVAVFIGERPGLSSPDSLGVYLTWDPRPGRTDAERNCISNVRAEGLSYQAAAHTLQFLMRESRARKLTGVPLKEGASQIG
ncbi:MAG TPA: ethanolamine ammonia-lyase light chain EutC, partial [Bryobacteraceae bacterium]